MGLLVAIPSSAVLLVMRFGSSLSRANDPSLHSQSMALSSLKQERLSFYLQTGLTLSNHVTSLLPNYARVPVSQPLTLSAQP